MHYLLEIQEDLAVSHTRLRKYLRKAKRKIIKKSKEEHEEVKANELEANNEDVNSDNHDDESSSNSESDMDAFDKSKHISTAQNNKYEP